MISELDINAIRFGILCNFIPICGEERAKEAVEVITNIWERLKAYEDSGKTPEEVKAWAQAEKEAQP